MVDKFDVNRKRCSEEKRLVLGECFTRASLKGMQSRMIDFRWIWVFLKEKTAKFSIRREHEIMQIESTTFGLQFAIEDRRLDSDLRWTQEPAEEISGWYELQRSVWRILVLLVTIFESENRIDYNTLSSKTLSNLNLLSQLTNLARGPWNSFTRFFSGIDSTIISIHFLLVNWKRVTAWSVMRRGG